MNSTEYQLQQLQLRVRELETRILQLEDRAVFNPPTQQHFDHTKAANTALRDAQNRSTSIARAIVKGINNVNIAKQPTQYPEGDVVGPCVCGSWPGGKCLKCPRVEQPAQQEPVAWLVVSKYSGGKRLDVEWNIDADAMAFALGRLPLYTTPQAQRKPLTDEQIIDIRRKTAATTFGTLADTKAFARALELAHNIK